MSVMGRATCQSPLSAFGSLFFATPVPACPTWRINRRSPRLLQMLQHLAAQRRLFIGAPFAKALARLEAELALRHQRLEIRRRAGAALDRRQHGLMNGE